MLNLDNCKYVVWGFKNFYHTHAHIHEGFYRALKLTDKEVQWLDHGSDLSKVDFSDTLFITEHVAAKNGMPVRDDCFYVVHGMSDDAECRSVVNVHNRLSWNVYHDFSHVYGTQGNPAAHGITTMQIPLTDKIWLAEDTPFYPREKHIDFRWATDLIPSEIEANKPGIILTDKRIIHWVGTQWHVNEKELTAFKKACAENGVEFSAIGAGQKGVVSIEDNIRLVRESYFAPAIVGSHHIVEGYAPCRIFKNISYGRMGITNSPRVNSIFGGKLIFNTDPYQLFYDAVDQLKSLDVSRIHELMDEVAKKHTYLNRIDAILKAARVISEDK